MKKTQLRSLKCLFVSVMLLGLTACAAGGTMVHHSFSFDTIEDSPDAEVLDYQYGDGRQDGTHADKERVALGQVFPADNISGVIPRGDFLYVKWRVKKPGSQTEYLGPYEDKVDLRSRLPADITGLRIHFVIRGPQLYVYLIWPYDPKHEYPLGELKEFGRVKQVQIYPDQPK